MKISEIMMPAPITIGASEPVSAAKHLMVTHEIKHLPVVDDDGQLVGILTDRDIKMRQAVADDPKFHDTAIVSTVAVMTPYTVSPDTSAGKVVRHMVDHHIGSALIADDGALVGIFTSMDACRVLAEYLE